MLSNQVLLVLAACALGAGALRVAGRIANGGLIDQVLVAAPLAVGFVVCWTLALGIVGLSGSSAALAAGPVLAWLLARLLVRGRASVLSTLQVYWNRWSRRERMAACGLLGVAAGAVLEVALQPTLGNDALWYHLADVVGWLHSGHAGSVQTFSYDLPFGYYPVTGEVLLTWVLGISRSFAPLAIWSTGVAALTLLALWRLLDVLRVPRAVAIASVSAFGTLPLVLQGLNQAAPGTDLLAVMWLACAAALCSRAAAREALQRGADVVVMLHPDGQYEAELIPELIAPIILGEADMVLGSRLAEPGAARAGGMPRYKRFANRILTGIENRILGTKLSELHTGYRAYSRDFLMTVPFLRNSLDYSFDSEVLMQAAQFGFRIAEVPARSRYFDDASSIRFWPALIYGLKTLWAAVRLAASTRDLAFPQADGLSSAACGARE